MTQELVLIFFTGVAGGLAREFFRWKRLYKQKRAKLFFRPIFLMIMLIELVFCGIVAVLFSNLVVGTNYIYPVAFVCGAGVEKLVKLAAKLEVWVPDVHLGDSDGQDIPTTLEFFRS